MIKENRSNDESSMLNTSCNILDSGIKMPSIAGVNPADLLIFGPKEQCDTSCKVCLLYIRSKKIANASVMPLGVLYVAAVLEEHDFEVTVFDSLFEKDDNLVQAVREVNPGIIGLSFLTSEYGAALSMIKQLKSVCPDSIYMAGGPHISSCIGIEAALKLGLDFAVYGEGEATCLELCLRIRSNRDTKDIPGIYWRDRDGQMVKNPPLPLISDIDLLPFPARHLIKGEKYLLPPGYIRHYFSNGTFVLLSSRGCNSHCTFCDSQITFGRKVRRRKVAKVIEEIEQASRFLSFESIYFLDDTFTLNHEWLYRWCDEIKKMDIPWGCQTRVSSVNRDILFKMKDSGCVQVDYGVESGSLKVLKSIKKSQTPEKIIRAFELTREIGLRTFASMIVGLPEEREEDVKLSMDLVKQIKPDFLHVTFATPLPGTELYDQCIQNGWIDEKMCEELDWDFVNSENPVLKVKFTTKELKRNRKRLQNTNFLRNYMSVFTLRNARYVLMGILAGIKQPVSLFGALRIYFENRNMDVLVMYFYRQYQIELLARLRNQS